MSQMNSNVRKQIDDIYRRFSEEAHYRPAAPSDGLGNLTVPEDELDLAGEQRKFAAKWWQQEDECEFFIGCSDFEYRKVMICCVEAARGCCSEYSLIRPMLEMALDELSKVEERKTQEGRQYPRMR
jgi:hypothetical protein